MPALAGSVELAVPVLIRWSARPPPLRALPGGSVRMSLSLRFVLPLAPLVDRLFAIERRRRLSGKFAEGN